MIELSSTSLFDTIIFVLVVVVDVDVDDDEMEEGTTKPLMLDLVANINPSTDVIKFNARKEMITRKEGRQCPLYLFFIVPIKKN